MINMTNLTYPKGQNWEDQDDAEEKEEEREVGAETVDEGYLRFAVVLESRIGSMFGGASCDLYLLSLIGML